MNTLPCNRSDNLATDRGGAPGGGASAALAEPPDGPVRDPAASEAQACFEDLTWLFTCDNRNRGILRMNLDEAALLWRSVRGTAGPILEIGRRHGGSTCLILAASGARPVVSVDLAPAHHPSCDRVFARPEHSSRLKLVVADSHAFRSESCGLLFVDGDHSYEGVRGDVLAHWNSLKPGHGRPALAVFQDAVPNEGLAYEGRANFCEGVQRTCDALLANGCAEVQARAGSVLVLRKLAELDPSILPASTPAPAELPAPVGSFVRQLAQCFGSRTLLQVDWASDRRAQTTAFQPDGHAPVAPRVGGADATIPGLPASHAGADTVFNLGSLNRVSEAALPGWLRELYRVTNKDLWVAVEAAAGRDRAWWETRFFAAGFRKHPLLMRLQPYETLYPEGGALTFVLEKVPAAALERYPLGALAAERDLHMDMFRETGPRSDAHIARYQLAAEFAQAGDVIVDLASGLGYGSALLARQFPNATVIGVDNSLYGVTYARENFARGLPNLEFHLADACDFRWLGDRKVSLLVSFETIEHVPDPDGFLRGITQRMAPGARFIGSVPNRWVDETGRDPNPFHLQVFDFAKFDALVARHFGLARVVRQNAERGAKGDHGRILRSIPNNQPGPDDEAHAEWWILVGQLQPVAVQGPTGATLPNPFVPVPDAELDVATDEFLTVSGTGRTLVAMPGAGAIVSRLLARGVEAWGLDPSPANGHDLATDRCVSGGLDLLPFDRAPFESAYLAGVLDDLPPGELRALAARLRESGVKSLVIRVGRRATQPPESRDRVWWERIFLGAGFRKHPLRFRVLPYERLAHRDGEILLHFERVTPAGAVRDRILVDDGLANDPSRQAGALSDALLVRYELAVPFVRPGSTVLDLGCETGAGLHLLQRATRAARFIGAHPEPASIDYAQAHFGTHTTDFRCAAPADLLEELPEASVDFVILAQDLEEADAVDGLLNGAARILAPGGRLMFVFRAGTLCLPRQLEDALRGRFLLETSYHQAGGGGPADFISVTRSDLNRLTFDSADTWVVVAMKDPVCHPVPEYRETVFGHVAPSGHASLRYPEFYRNPWILHSLLHAGYRATSPTILVDSAVRLLREMPAESADLGAALCLLIYRTIEGDAPTDPPLSELLERSRAYLSIPVPNVHQLRWQVSISYALGVFHLRLGDFPLAREGFERCAAMDSLAFSTHLATKTTDALFWSGWLAYTSGDGDEAGAAWKRGLEFGERLLRQPLNDTLMNPACPNLFDYGDGMRELIYALENVAKCANGIHCLDLEAQGISTRWDLIHNSFRFQHGTVTDALRYAQRQVERLCEDVAQARAQHEATRRELRERTAELNQARQLLQEAKAPPVTQASPQQLREVVAHLARLQKAPPPPAARRR
ncbi:MAG: methyltransferase domain-containing protein [Limisphaerales bacterium]